MREVAVGYTLDHHAESDVVDLLIRLVCKPDRTAGGLRPVVPRSPARDLLEFKAAAVAAVAGANAISAPPNSTKATST